jgi:hypothetical protein
MSTQDHGLEFLSSVKAVFSNNKGWADRAIAQVSDEKLHLSLAPNTNSIAVIMKHVAGNLLSRWTDFLESDGEKPWRNRDNEFVDNFSSRKDVLDYWEKGWGCLFDTLNSLTSEDFSKSVAIRGEAHSVSLAIHRSLAHCGYHVGQIIMVARIHAGDEWEVISVPPGKSAEFNERVWGQAGFNKGR